MELSGRGLRRGKEDGVGGSTCQDPELSREQEAGPGSSRLGPGQPEEGAGTGMLDTGANISIIRAAEWPLDGGKVMAPSRLLGVGETDATKTFVSASYLQVYGPNQIVIYY